MIDPVVAFIVDESKWLTMSMGLAFLAVAFQLHRHRRSDFSPRHRVLAAMNLFFGVTIGTMALGHLLAVTTKLAMGTLEGSLPIFYGIGIVWPRPPGAS